MWPVACTSLRPSATKGRCLPHHGGKRLWEGGTVGSNSGPSGQGHLATSGDNLGYCILEGRYIPALLGRGKSMAPSQPYPGQPSKARLFQTAQCPEQETWCRLNSLGSYSGATREGMGRWLPAASLHSSHTMSAVVSSREDATAKIPGFTMSNEKWAPRWERPQAWCPGSACPLHSDTDHRQVTLVLHHPTPSKKPSRPSVA